MSSPLALNPVGRVFLKLEEKIQMKAWDFAIFSHDSQSNNESPVSHGSGCVSISESGIPPLISNFQTLSSLMLQRCQDIESSSTSTGFKGPTVYQAMRRVVTYLDYFHGIQSYYTSGNEAVARIAIPSSRPSHMGTGFCDPVLIDSFTQAGGVLANCFCIDDDGEMWICNFIGDITFTQKFVETGRKRQLWTAYTKYEKPAPKKLQCDIFVFDPESGDLVLTIMAISFQKSSIKSLTRVLGRLNSNKHRIKAAPEERSPDRVRVNIAYETPYVVTTAVEEPPKGTEATVVDHSGSLQPTRRMLSDVLEIPVEEILPESDLADLGIDSLMATELFTEMRKRFNSLLSHSDFATVTDVRGLARLIPNPSPTPSSSLATTSTSISSRRSTAASTPVEIETIMYGKRDELSLSADIYYPSEIGDTRKPLPIALMIHGGGHVISTRKDIRDDQTQILLRAGFLPISVDYRLCPETTLKEGAMQDVCDAFRWARQILPNLKLSRPDIRADGERVVAVGWSSGAHLAMTLGWTASSLGVRPPEAVLAFYGPTDYEDPFWVQPNLPFNHKPIPPPGDGYDHLYDGLHDKPVVGYSPAASLRALGGWMSLDDPRSRTILHMNWEGKSLPVLINGLRHTGNPALRCVTSPAAPSKTQIQDISPLAQIRAGRYKTPTFLIHGTRDDLVPWQASQRTHEALLEQGIPSKLVILKDALHLFDIYHGSKRNADSIGAVNGGYGFLSAHV
ncbi:Alpha/Beta hydrolase protein [Xylariales sp. AK1849]|nr:Alpha/Beta hydrolase protein [Xylariales sp. AK1849]